MPTNLPVGKLSPKLLKQLLAQIPLIDPRILLGPGIGVDCAVLDLGTTLLVLKSDPITFATDEIGWYAVQINANDIATTGALPRWFMTTLLLPEDHTTPEMVAEIHRELKPGLPADQCLHHRRTHRNHLWSRSSYPGGNNDRRSRSPKPGNPLWCQPR